jgi:acyl carrier protein
MNMEPIVPDEIAAAFRTAMRLDESFVVEDQMGFEDIPGWDSVGHMNLISELESRFGVALEMDEIVALDTVAAVRKLVAGKKTRKDEGGKNERDSP